MLALYTKKGKRSVMLIICTALLLTVISGCTTKRSDFDQGYDLGSSDVAKRQYWIVNNLQKQKQLYSKTGEVQYRTVELPVSGKNPDGTLIDPHYVKVRMLETR